MIALLQQPKSEGFPLDFLLARLRSRRQHSGQAMEGTGGESERWKRRQGVYRWLFAQLPPRARRRLAPCFIFLELQSLQMLLRAIYGGNRQMLEQIRWQSLLNQDLLEEIASCQSLRDLIGVLEHWLPDLPPGGAEWIDVFERGGRRALEESLADGILQRLCRSRQQPDVARFLSEQVDRRNLLTVARYLRWELADPPLIEGGGGLSRRLKKAAKSGEAASLQEILARFAGGEPADPARLERRMLERIGRRLETEVRVRPGPVLIIDYIWRLELAYRSVGVKAWAGEDIAEWEKLV